MIFIPIIIILMIFAFIVGFGVGNVCGDWYMENRPSSYKETKNFVDAYDTGKLKKTFKMRYFRYSVKNDFGYQLWLLYQLYPYYKDNDNEDNKDNKDNN